MRLLRLGLLAPLVSCAAAHWPDLAPAPTAELSTPLGKAVVSRGALPKDLNERQAQEFLTRLRDDLAGTNLFESVEIADGPSAGAIVVRPVFAPRTCLRL